MTERDLKFYNYSFRKRKSDRHKEKWKHAMQREMKISKKFFKIKKPFCFCRFYDMHERMHVLDGQCLSLSYVFLFFVFFCFENSSRCKTSL